MSGKTVLYITLAILFFLLFLELAARSFIIHKLTEALSSGDFKSYERYRNSELALLFIRGFNLLYMDLNKAMMQGDTDQIDEIAEKMSKLKLNNTQKEEIAAKSFYYYLSIEDKKKA